MLDIWRMRTAVALLVLPWLLACDDAAMPATTDAGAASEDAKIAADAAPGFPDAVPDAAVLPPWAGPGADPRVWRPRVIYLLIPDRFANGDPHNDDLGPPDCVDAASSSLFHGGDVAGLHAHLSYLEELGVGTVWVTPLHKQVPRRNGNCGYHGYWADLTVPAEPIEDVLEQRLGTPAELDALLADFAAADLRVLLDVVVNHPGRNARIVTQKPGWFHAAQGCELLGPPEIYCPLNGLPDFALEHAEVADHVTATTVAWLERYAFDGVRVDTAKHVPLDYFAQHWMPSARAARPYPFVVGEVFTDGAMAQFKRFFDAGFDSVFHFPLRRALVNAVAKGGSLDEVASVVQDTVTALGLQRALMISTFLDNHDVPRFMQEAGQLADGERVRRYRLALAALFTLPGIPQLYYGDELGMLGASPDNRRDMPAWAWQPATRAGARADYLGDPGETFALVRRLIALRSAHAALFEGYYREVWRPNGGKNLYAFYRAATHDRVLVVLWGGGAASGAITMPFVTNGGIPPADRAAWPDGTVLHDALGLGAPATLTVQNGKISASFPARTAGIYFAAP